MGVVTLAAKIELTKLQIFPKNLGLLNFRSLRSKANDINAFINAHELDILIFIETWLHKDKSDEFLLKHSVTDLSCFRFINSPRPYSGGVGLAILYKN